MVEINMDEAVRLYTSGETLETISNRFGCNYQTVRRRLVAAGVEIRKPGPKKAEIDLREVSRLREEGLTMSEVAEKLGTTRDIVAKRCVEHGIVYGVGRSPANCKANAKNAKHGGIPLEKREQAFVKRLASDERTAMYEYVGGYKSKYEKLTVRCRRCGELWETTPKHLFNHRYERHICFNCARTEREIANGERRRAWEEHEAAEYAKDKVCSTCGRVYHSTSDTSKYCSKECRRRRKDHGHRARARRYGVEYDVSITWKSLSDRNGNLDCQICGEPCDPSDIRWNGLFGPLYPTVDCIVAMSNGGGYVWDNVQLAHAICNSAKRDLVDENEIERAVVRYAPDGGHHGKRDANTTAENAGSRAGERDRRRGRVAQHGAACAAVSRDDTRDCRAGGRDR